MILLAIGPPLLAGAWWTVRTPGALRSFIEVAGIVTQVALGLVFVAAPVFALAYVVAQIAAAITKR